MPDLIQTGTTKGWQPLSHPTPDAAVAIAPIENTAVINGETRRVGCFIRKYSDGSIYYDLFINKTAVDLTENITRANNGFDINSINQYDEEVNLFIYGD